MDPKVSIIIPNYNYGRYIGETLQSILRQSFKDYEVIVVDDGSTDNSAQEVERFRGDFGGKLRYFYQKNQGVATARNHGISQARGQFIAFIDADDLWLEQSLSKIVAFMETHPECGLVYGNVQIVDLKKNTLIKVRFSPSSSEKPYEGKCFEKLFCEGNFIPTAAVLMPRVVFKQIGLFDTRFKCGEDLDMWLRISALYPIRYLDEVLTIMRRHDTSLSHGYLASAKADILMIRKFSKLMPLFKEVVGIKKIQEKLWEAYYRMGIFLILKGRGRRGRIWLVKALRVNFNLFKKKILAYVVLSYVPFANSFNGLRNSLHYLFKERW